MRKMIIAAAIVCVLLPVLSHAQRLHVNLPQADGFSPTNLERIDSLFDSFTKDHKIAGVCALIVRHGHIDYWSASGYADIEKK